MHFEIHDMRGHMRAREFNARVTGDPLGATDLTDEEWDDRVTVEPSAEAPNGFVHDYSPGPECGIDYQLSPR